MKKHWMVSLLLSLSLLLSIAWIVRAKLPPGYSYTRGLYIFWDTPENELNPPQLPVVGGFWRYNWSALEPTNGGYTWGALDNWIQREQARGKLVGIGFSFFNKYSGWGSDRGLQIPSWLWSIDPDVRWRNTRRPAEYWYVPNYWNTTFQNYYQRFINAFAQHLADNPSIRDRVAWVSMGVGLDGETQPACRWNCPGDEPDWYFYHDDKGITQAQWVQYVNWCSNMYKQAFSSRGLNIPIFIDIGPTYIGGGAERAEFSSYAASIGVGLRNNGLKMDRENGVIYEPMKQYSNTVPIAWETYGTPNWLDSKPAVFWGLMCGLAKHPDNFTVDRTLVTTEEYLPLLQFAARYCAVTLADTPGVWVALRDTQQSAGERGNSSFWLYQHDGASANTTPVWNVGESRGYKFDVPNGSYEVELHFAEVYYNVAGARIFDIKIEDQIMASNFDIWVAAGGKNRPVVRTFSKVVSDGRLDIDFVPKTANEPTIHAIKVTGPGYTQRVNCGGRTYTDHASNVWAADREYEVGSFGYIGGFMYSTSDDIIGTEDDHLYQTMRVVTTGSPALGRFARRTDQAAGNRYMRFDIDNGYMYASSGQATITVTYFATGNDAWELRYDAVSDANKLAGRIQKDNSGLWKRAVFSLTDVYFGNRQPGSTDFSIDCLNDGDEYISFVEVSKGGVGPTTATIQGHVDLQGRPTPPNSQWSIPLTVTVGSTNYTCNTDQSGNFTLSGLTPGTYDIRVKNHHTLRNVKSGVTLVAGTNTINFGTLREGDANNDNCVNITDFSLLKSVFGSSDPRADFNQDGYVNISDFSLLKSNFGLCGDVAASSSSLSSASQVTVAETAAGTVQVSIEPVSSLVVENQIFTVNIQISAIGQPVDGAEVHLNFDPLYLRVVDDIGNPSSTIENSDILDVPIQNNVDNANGRIDFAAGTFSATPPSGTFTLATIRFKALRGTGGSSTPLTFITQLPRKTDVTYGGGSVLAGTIDGSVTINMGTGYRICLPFIVRP